MPSVSTDRRFGVNAGRAFKVPVVCATTGDTTLSGLQIIDGVQLLDGDRVLVFQQTNAVDNGIYDAATGSWNRSPDCNGTFDITQGSLVFVTRGTTHALEMYYISSDAPNEIDTDPVDFTKLHLIGSETFVTNFITNIAGQQNVPFVTAPTVPDRTLVGKCLGISAGITVPANVFTVAGDIFWVLNMTAAPLTLTQGTALTMNLAGSNASAGNRTLAANGIVPLYFPTPTSCYASGHVT